MSRKIIVAVHGIGDQVEYATIQMVADRIYDYCNPKCPFTIPLGRFHSALKDDKKPGRPGAYFPDEPDPRIPDPSAPSTIGFTEVYWADICRVPAREGYTLEEARRWVKTMVNRIRRFDDQEKERENEYNNPPRVIDYDRIQLVLNESIDTVNVAERLISILVKMNLIQPFELNAVLNDFVGDVQFVAEFVPFRERILARFDNTLKAVKLEPTDEIYIVAHSEGTVVTFLALLQALGPPQPEWIKHVKGLMTIGSPIDKHLILFPDIWPAAKYVPFDGAPTIKWWNYFDKGDPVGYELDTARDWMKCQGWNQVFELTQSTECGFTRYPLPGKAHNDYWTDVELFDHFLGDTVVSNPPPLRKPPRPASKPLAQVTSYVLPYLLSALLLIAGIYLLDRGITQYFVYSPGILERALHVLGFSCLLAGVTVMARIPRLTTRLYWHAVAVGVFILAAASFYGITPHRSFEPYREALHEVSWLPALLKPETDQHFAILGLCVGAVVAVLAYLISKKKPSSRMKPLIGIGACVVLAFVAARVVYQRPAEPLWPLVLAFTAFSFLWWLAALSFDLAFVWHLYVRSSLATKALCNRHWEHVRTWEQSPAPSDT